MLWRHAGVDVHVACAVPDPRINPQHTLRPLCKLPTLWQHAKHSCTQCTLPPASPSPPQSQAHLEVAVDDTHVVAMRHDTDDGAHERRGILRTEHARAYAMVSLSAPTA